MSNPTKQRSKITVTQEDLKHEVPVVRELMKSVFLVDSITKLVPGPFGMTKEHLSVLETAELAGARILEIYKGLSNHILSDRRGAGFAFSARLEPADQAFCLLFAVYVACDGASQALASLTTSELDVQGSFKAEWVGRLRSQDAESVTLSMLGELNKFLGRHRDHPDPARRLEESIQLIECSAAYFRLLSNSVLEQVTDIEFEPYRKALESVEIEVNGRIYHGFSVQATAQSEEPSDILPVWPKDVVGNREYLAAGMRLARDVAGFDFEHRSNPKKLNPVLFGQGAPGCGKTVTAHAVGNFFLDYCRQRKIPAKFLVIRRTDWASSYQNASAGALVKIFKEEVDAFEGVVGVYWPDIDTAFAARSDGGMKSEESNILGASFGIFDGTLIPKNGKWFLMCDANYMNMDEATLSRISQDPHKILGPSTPEDYVELMRDKKLSEFADYLHLTDEEWLVVGQQCIDSGFSGRNVEAICSKLLTEMQDVEPPDEYYQVSFEERKAILRSLAKPITQQRISEVFKQYKEFEKVAEEQNQAERFNKQVQEIVMNLSAQRAAARELAGQ